jgi:hypothetical protein
MDMDVKNTFIENKWNVIGQKDLVEKIWPESVKSLGKPFR